MKLLNKIFISLLMITVILSSTNGESIKKKYFPGQILIKFKESNGKFNINNEINQVISKYNLNKIENAFKSKNISTAKSIAEKNLALMMVGYVAITTDIEALAHKLNREPIIEYAEPNYFVEADAIPNDPLYGQLQHLPQVKAPQAWDVSQGDTSVLIAILDTGVDWDHPDLTNAIWINYDEIPDNGIDDDGNGFIDDIRGWDFVTGVASNAYPGEDGDVPDNNPMDFNGHGTHVAGIAAGVTNNGIGIASLVWTAKIMPIRIGYHTTGGNGLGTLLWMAQGFVYAGDNGAHVANLSFGTGDGSFVNDAAKYAFQKGVVICNSAGNGNNESVGALGATPFALSVASVNESDVKASYSTYGELVDISAPGGDALGILSTIVNPSPFYTSLYTRFSGTSMASPLVASLAGLIKAKNPTWSAAQITFQIVGTADDIYNLNPNYIGKLGSGRINAYRALTETISPPKPKLELIDYSFYEIEGDMDGNFESGEKIGLIITIENRWGDAFNAQTTLTSEHWAINITNASVIFDTILGISNIENSIKSNIVPFEFIIHPQTLPEIATLNLQINADGYSKEFIIDFPINPSIFLVDDNDGKVGLNEYIDAIKTLGGVYRYWDRESQGSPPASEMMKYSTVIWYADLYVHPFLDSADRANLGTYLDNGGNLFIAGMDFGWEMADPDGGEYKSTNGQSKLWFENYLKARYIADGSSYRNIIGIANDPIGNKLNFNFINPWPEVIDTLGGSTPIFKYPDNSIAGIKYDGNHRLVYIGFSSLENIPHTSVRRTILERSISWLNQFNIKVSRVNDTEDVGTPLPVTAEISTRDSILSVFLAYSKDGARPYNKVLMNKISDNFYEANIPPVSSPGGDIEYKILVETIKGILPSKSYYFRAGPDIKPPVLTVIKPIQHSLNVIGPYKAAVVVTDNIAVNKDSVFIFYKKDGDVQEQRANLSHWFENTFSDTFSLNSPAVGGQQILYYFTAKDSSSNQNIGRYPDNGYLSFVIGREIIEDFESGTDNWDLGKYWGLTDTLKNSEKYSITDSPLGNYLPNTQDTLTMIKGINLSYFSGGQIKFWRSIRLNTGDTVFVDISRNAIEWETIRFYRKQFPWVATISGFDSVNIDQYYGAGNDNVKLRFRLVSNSTLEADGIYIDDIEFISTETTLNVISDNRIPSNYILHQNYPNPFNPVTKVKYELPQVSYISLKVYNILGQEVRILYEGLQNMGTYELTWDGKNNYDTNLPSGIYIYRIEAIPQNNSSVIFSQSKKMILLK